MKSLLIGVRLGWCAVKFGLLCPKLLGVVRQNVVVTRRGNGAVRWQNVTAFLASLLVVGVFWGGVLPWVGRLPSVRARIQRQELGGVDPSAMFYTELGDISGVRLRRNGASWCVEEFQLGK